jgi:ABC-type branched-subunit amino acid transport system permease subunit
MSTPQAHLETLPRSVQLLLALGLLALLAFPFAGQDFYTQMVTRMMILAIFAMSLDLLQGITGLVSLGHAAYFGLAGYVLAFMSPADLERRRVALKTSPAASLVCETAVLTPTTFLVTSIVPVAACSTLRAISLVAAPCSSTALAMAVEM